MAVTKRNRREIKECGSREITRERIKRERRASNEMRCSFQAGHVHREVERSAAFFVKALKKDEEEEEERNKIKRKEQERKQEKNGKK